MHNYPIREKNMRCTFHIFERSESLKMRQKYGKKYRNLRKTTDSV